MSEENTEGTPIFTYIKYGLYAVVALYVISTFIFKGDGAAEYVDEEILEPTQGVVTEVKEIESELYKITDETVVATKEDSRIIAEYLDGVRDTFTLDEAQLVDANNPRRSMIRGVVMGGLMGYMMAGRMSRPLNRSSYANEKTYSKGKNQGTSTLKQTAARKTVRTPKSGFGSGKSTRSYGG